MSAHSKLSPSSRHRWSKCPGSVREEAKYPDSSGEAALDGTRSHELLEHCLTEVVLPQSLVGELISGFIVDAERAARVQIAYDYIVQADDYYSERRVSPAKYVMRDDMDGTADAILLHDRCLEIVDYKDGVSPVSAVGNAQMEVYALGALARFGAIYETVKMTIIQPKLAIRGLPTISSHEITVDELLAKVPGIIAEAAATDAPDAPLIPGESQCKWCKAKGNCPALVEKSLELVNVSALDLSLIHI